MLISYSQNREDIYLYRILKQVKNGFYIDVGANDPITDSVTKLFYDIGWSGINIEPELKWFKRLKKERPNDINLNFLISNQIKIESFVSSKIRGQSTMNKSFIKNENIKKITQKKTETLNNVLDKFQIRRDIHFLKIDVEGNEKKVLEGIDLNFYRPWVLVIETLKPNSIDHECYSEYLEIFNYKCFFNDGINSYYIANEKKSLIKSNFNPVNVFDDFLTYQEYLGSVFKNENKNLLNENRKLLLKVKKQKSEILLLKSNLCFIVSSHIKQLIKKLNLNK